MSLYHGSQIHGLKLLKPKPSHVLGGEQAVFATPIFDVAITFLVPWTDEDFEQGQVNAQFYMREQYPNAFGKFKNKKGSIYTVDSEGFNSDPRLTRYEVVATQLTEVIDETVVPDVLVALNKSRFLLLKFGQKAPWELSKREIVK